MKQRGFAFVEVAEDHLVLRPFDQLEIGDRFWFVEDADGAIERALAAEDWPRAEWLALERLPEAELLQLDRVKGREGAEGCMEVSALTVVRGE